MRNPPGEESSQETFLGASENVAGHGLLMIVGRVISPPRTELSKLRPALTPGEWRVFELLDASLPIEWEIYVQPHLNGTRPDFIVLNPSAGIGVIEVKDWNLRAIHYKRSTGKDGAVRLIGLKANGETFRERDPLTQARIYKDELFELYCPRLEEKMGYAAISVGVVFPNAAEIELKALFPKDMMNEREYVVGNETLSEGKVSGLHSSFKYSNSKIMSEEMAEDLRGWLREPDSVAEQREPLRLDPIQRDLVVDRTSRGYRRIRGPAGSGKSIVLAARASRLAGEGKKVLVSTFNITMLHFLRDLSARAGEGHPNRITWLNLHAWCKRIAYELDLVDEYSAIWRKHHQGHGDAFSEVADLLIQNSGALSRSKSCTYDAILVDEGQDFQPLWWQALRLALRPEGEMLLVADATQDIYETARLWTNEAMTGAGFTGRWNELATSYRLPASLAEIAKKFAVQFLPVETRMLPRAPAAQGEFEYDRCELKWVQVENDKVLSRSVNELLRLMTEEESAERTRVMSDLTVLTDSTVVGRRIAKELNLRGIKTIETFNPEPESRDGRNKSSRRKKMAFWKGRECVKLSTLHSYKGWESRLQVLVITKFLSLTDRSLVYTGLTRLKRHQDGSCLTVVCCEPSLKSFGSSWPQFEDHSERFA